MRLAFLGAGHWHASMHADAAKAADARIVAVWDHDAAKAASFAGVHGGLAVASIDEALSVGPDLAVVMGRPAEMAQTAMRLVEAGVPMLIEKPVGLSAAALKPLADLAEASGAFVAVALAHRFSPLAGEAAALRRAGRLGSVSHAHFRLINGPPRRYADDGCAWVLDAAQSGGGALRNLGIHGIDAFAALAGDQDIGVESVSFGRQLHGTSVEDYAVVVLRAADGSIGLVEAGYTHASMTGGIFEWRVAAANASLADLGGRLRVATLDDGALRETEAVPVARRYEALMADAIDCLRNRMKPAATLRDHWRAMDIIDRCYAMAGTRD